MENIYPINWWKQNRGIILLDRDIRKGRPYQDNLCFFRCLALHNGCHTKNLERDTKHYYQQYREAGLVKKKFHGVKLSELDELERLCEVNIQVYNLAPDRPTVKKKKKKKKKKRDLTSLLHLAAAHIAIMKALFT